MQDNLNMLAFERPISQTVMQAAKGALVGSRPATAMSGVTLRTIFFQVNFSYCLV
jgi:hypothetical protein